MRSRLQKTWAKIAEMYDTPYAERTPDEQRITDWGLCNALQELGEENEANRMAPATKGMVEEYWLCPTRSGHSCFYFTDDCDAERATVAWLMSHVTDEEREEILRYA